MVLNVSKMGGLQTIIDNYRYLLIIDEFSSISNSLSNMFIEHTEVGSRKSELDSTHLVQMYRWKL